MQPMQAISKSKNLKLIIEHDENAGFYLYVYPLNSNRSIADYLCDTLEEALFEAKDRYEVEKNDWGMILQE